MKQPDMKVDLGRGLILKNPVMTASGTFGYGEEASRYFDISRLGAVVVKGVSLAPRAGNPPPRIVETPSGMLNSIGLQNVGVSAFIEQKMPFLREAEATVVVNILGGSEEEYLKVAGLLNGVEGVDALEVNISCPNVKEGGVQFGMRADLASCLVDALRKCTDLHLMVKLSPNVSNIGEMAYAVQEAGADSVSLINTITGMDIDVTSRKPVLGGTMGGLSGPAIRPVALRMVHESFRSISIPVVGIGGIVESEHALKFMIAGAAAVQVGTAVFNDPMAPINILKGIKEFLAEENIGSAGELTGTLVI